MNDPKVDAVLVVGVGWIGRQIAAQLVAHGVRVQLFDVNAQAVSSSLEWIAGHLRSQVRSQSWRSDQVMNWEERITVISKLGEADCGLILECTPEQASSKRRILIHLSQVYAAPRILASNTSYFIPSHFVEHIHAPERYLHWHFHAPVWFTQLVDIVPCAHTLPAVVERVCALSERIGQRYIVQNKENSGYIFNVLLRGVLQSALQLWNDGVATPEQIDFVWRTITRMERGPFGIMDEIGLDVVQQAFRNAKWDLQRSDIDAWIDRLNEFVQAGKLGVKSGEGFFPYQENRE